MWQHKDRNNVNMLVFGRISFGATNMSVPNLSSQRDKAPANEKLRCCRKHGPVVLQGQLEASECDSQLASQKNKEWASTTNPQKLLGLAMTQ